MELNIAANVVGFFFRYAKAILLLAKEFSLAIKEYTAVIKRCSL